MSTLFLILLFLSNAGWDLIARPPKSVLVFPGFSHRLLLWPEMPAFSIDEWIFFFPFKDSTGKFSPLNYSVFENSCFFFFFKLALAMVINLHWLNHPTQLCSQVLCLKLIKILKAHNKIKYTFMLPYPHPPVLTKTRLVGLADLWVLFSLLSFLSFFLFNCMECKSLLGARGSMTIFPSNKLILYNLRYKGYF